MKYTFDNTEYDVKITDLQPYEGINRRVFDLRNPSEKGYCFHVKYTLENGKPKVNYVREETGAFPEYEQSEVFYKSIEIEPLPSEEISN